MFLSWLIRAKVVQSSKEVKLVLSYRRVSIHPLVQSQVQKSSEMFLSNVKPDKQGQVQTYFWHLGLNLQAWDKATLTISVIGGYLCHAKEGPFVRGSPLSHIVVADSRDRNI